MKNKNQWLVSLLVIRETLKSWLRWWTGVPIKYNEIKPIGQVFDTTKCPTCGTYVNQKIELRTWQSDLREDR